MSSKIEVQLTQYTPLLHFQGQESGACLRASEVKPALDNFITAWLKKENKSAPQDWIQSEVNGHTAYRYRMTFTAIGEPEGGYKCNTGTYNKRNNTVKVDNTRQIHNLFFASMGPEAFDITPETRDRETVKSRIKSVFYPKGTTMTILVPGDQENKLSALLKELIPPFFALHCFGNRSNKGFGSFGVTEMDGKEIPVMTPAQLAEYAPNQKTLYYVSYGQIIPSSNEYLNDVFTLSNLMKPGINYTHGNPKNLQYSKGFLFQYFLDKKIHSEKAAIKSFVLNEGTEDEDNFVKIHFHETFDGENDDFRFVRAIIGLPQQYEYRIDERFNKEKKEMVFINPHSRRKGTVAVENRVKIEGKPEKKDKTPIISRYENPVHFKPHGQYLLIVPQTIKETMKDQTFYLIDNTQGSSKITGRENGIAVVSSEDDVTEIKTPSEFDLIDFLDYFSNQYKFSYNSLNNHFSSERGPAKVIYESLDHIGMKIQKAKAGEKNNG